MRKPVLRIIALLIAFGIGVGAAQVLQVARLTAARGAAARFGFDLPDVLPALTAPPLELEAYWEPPQSPSLIARVVETGEFHGDEVNAHTGERWLGLYVTNKGSFLIDSALTVTTIKDVLVDDDKSTEKTGKRVSVNQRDKPILLVKGAGTLRPGPISTVFAGRMALTNATSTHLTLGAASYGLSVVTKDTKESFSIQHNDAKLILNRNSENEQVLYDLGGTGQEIEGYWELLWAGDMDGDNKLDLYVQVGWHYNSTQRKLFLSSYARKGKLVREVAELSTSGC